MIDDLVRIHTELKLLRENYPGYIRLIEAIRREYDVEVTQISKKYDLRINALFEQIVKDSRVKL